MTGKNMRGGPFLVMLVEDNPDHAELVIRILESHPIPNQIKHFSDGINVLDYLFRRGEYEKPESSPRPQLILLDLRLPRVDGLEVLFQIKEHPELKNIPVIILSTSETKKDVMSAYENRANSFLVKPAGLEEFSKLLNDLVNFWLGWNTLPPENKSQS